MPRPVRSIPSHAAPRLLLALLALVAALCLDVTTAYAQSAACTRLQATLESLNRSPDFRRMEALGQQARQIGNGVQDAESAYIRNGCNDDARAGRTLSPQCQRIAREVLRAREDYAAAEQALGTGMAVAEQREAVLQEQARFGCSRDGSSASFNQGETRQGLFDRVFGSATDGFGDGEFIQGNEDYWGFGTYSTVRTLCVRLSDGYYWPISYSTLREYVPNDLAACQAQCPGTAVDLFFHDNPGQEVEQAVNQYGEAYTALGNAFRYREALDKTSTCNPNTVQGGTINIAQGSDGKSRAVIAYGGKIFPMPLRDPRRSAATPAPAVVQPTVTTAELVTVPLPRPRPAGPGEEPPPRPVQTEDDAAELRLVQFGDKVVRVVGPDTPYAQPAEAGT